MNSFIGQYLPILQFPSDATDALISGQINLQEAAQLARLTPERIGCSQKEARAFRDKNLHDHLALQASQTRLRTHVKEFLGENLSKAVSSECMTAVVARVDELLVIDPHDTRHLFWEELKGIFYAMREIELDDLDEATVNEFMVAMDHIFECSFSHRET